MISKSEASPQRASALIIALTMVAVLASLGAATFVYINDRYRVVHDAASWHEALHSAEAGVELALTEIRRELTGMEQFKESRGWTTEGDDAHAYANKKVLLRRGEGGTESWILIRADVPFVDSTGEKWWRVRSHGYCRIPGGIRAAGGKEDIRLRKLSLNADRYTGATGADAMFQVAPSEGPVAHRAVEAIIRPVSAFQMALFGKKRIDLTNHSIVIDSYDSRDKNKSYWKDGATYGTYPWINGDKTQGVDESKRQWHGDIGTNGSIINADGAYIFGTVNTNQSSTLDNDNVTGHFQGDPDRIRKDFSMDVVDVIAPSPTEEPASPAYRTMVSVVGNTAIQANEGSPTVVRLSNISLTGQDTLLIKGKPGATTDAHIFVSGDITVSNLSQIILEQGVRVRIFVAGDASILGKGVANPNPPVNFQLYGTARSSSDSSSTGYVKVASNGYFSGAIYAPAYDIEFLGSGGHADNIFGGFVGNSVRMNGIERAHYDEALADGGIIVGFKVASWFEDER